MGSETEMQSSSVSWISTSGSSTSILDKKSGTSSKERDPEAAYNFLRMFHLALAGSTDLLLPGTLLFPCGPSRPSFDKGPASSVSAVVFRTFASWDLPVEVDQCNAY